MDIFSLGTPKNKDADDLIEEFNVFRSKLSANNVLNEANVKLVKSLKTIHPIGVKSPRFAYTVQFPVTNNDWTSPLFSFLISISDRYRIASSYTKEGITSDLFDFDVTNPHNRYPFVFWKMDELF